MTGPAALFALAALAVALALQISSGTYDERALALVTLATIAALIGVVWRRSVAIWTGQRLVAAVRRCTLPITITDNASAQAAFATGC